MDLLFQTIINGIVLGSVYAMVALGLTLIFGILEIPNFAHGALYMIGAYVAFFCISSMGVSYWFALVISIGVLFLIGMIIERFIYRPFYNQPHISSFIVAVGLIFILENSRRYIPRNIFDIFLIWFSEKVIKLVAKPSCLPIQYLPD